MNNPVETPESNTPTQLILPNSPPPPFDADITEPLRWAAAVANFAGHPDSIEFSAHERNVRATLRDERLMMIWAQIVGATLSGRVPDALGTVSWANTTDRTRWRVTLCAVVPDRTKDDHSQV